MVADVTGARTGVYFEAGYALGHGRQQADVKHMQTALAMAMRNLERHKTNATDRIRNAAGRALGESVTAGVAMDRTLSDLQDEERGLLIRLQEAERTATRHAGDYRAAVCHLLRKCAERAADDYVDATKRQAWAHLHLGIVEDLIGRVVDARYWSKYMVPGSDYLTALKNKSRLEDDGSGTTCLTYMSADKLSLGAANAAKELRQQLREMFGASPF